MSMIDEAMNCDMRIMALTYSLEKSYCGQIRRVLGIPDQTANRRLKLLEKKGLVSSKNGGDGNPHIREYHITQSGKTVVQEFLRQLWDPTMLVDYYRDEKERVYTELDNNSFLAKSNAAKKRWKK